MEKSLEQIVQVMQQKEGTCELFVAREMVEEERAETEKMPGL